MFKEIIDKYENFSDSLISNINYKRSSEDEGKIEIVIRCMNSYNNYEFEIIKLTILGIYKFRFLEEKGFSSLIINSALLVEQEDCIIIDFFPDIYKEKFVLNENSDFIIKAKSVIYELIG